MKYSIPPVANAQCTIAMYLSPWFNRFVSQTTCIRSLICKCVFKSTDPIYTNALELSARALAKQGQSVCMYFCLEWSGGCNESTAEDMSWHSALFWRFSCWSDRHGSLSSLMPSIGCSQGHIHDRVSEKHGVFRHRSPNQVIRPGFITYVCVCVIGVFYDIRMYGYTYVYRVRVRVRYEMFVACDCVWCGVY